MANIALLANNFSSGEIDPMLLGRVDIPMVASGLTTLKNGIPLRNGGLRRIPGTYWWGAGYSSGSVKCRWIEMPLTTGFYMVELSNLKARIWQADHTVVQYSSADLVLTTTITTAELFECQARVVNDELFIVHKSHKPQRIKVSTPAPFAIDEPTFTGSRSFSTTNNYPSTVTAYNGRLGLGATNAEPTGYFISRSPVASSGTFRLLDFTIGTNPDDAIIGYNTDGFGSRLLWLQAHRRMMAGMTNTVWADATGFPSAANFYMQTVGYRGAAAIQAAILENSLFYVGSPIPTLQMASFSNEAGGMSDIEISRYCRHILRAGIVQIATMASPETTLWLVRNDGKVAVIALDTAGGNITVGASLYELADGGLVESAAVSRTSSGDELWMWVNRGGTRYCETLKFTTDNDSDFTELHYVDAGIRWAGSSTYTVSGLSHLNGKTVHAIADGESMPAEVVAAGSVTYEKPFTKIHVGLPQETIYTPTRPEVQANATWQGKKKNVERVTLRISNSYGGKVAAGKAPADEDYQTIPFTGGPFQAFGSAPLPVTEDIDLTVGGPIDTDGVVTIKQDEPFPMTVLAVVTRIRIQEE